MKESKARDFTLDIIRVILTLWIVGIDHGWGYAGVSLPDKMTTITVIVLGSFFWLSGYLLGKYKFETIQDIQVFYKKRFFRFYLLFLASAIVFASGELLHKHWFSSIAQFFELILGIGFISSEPVPTLWFMSMLMFFYIITPIIRFSGQQTLLSSKIFKIFIILIPCLLVMLINGDVRYILFLPCYIIGLYTKTEWLKPIRDNCVLLFGGTIVILFFLIKYCGFRYYQGSFFILWPIILCGIVCVYSIGCIFNKLSTLRRGGGKCLIINKIIEWFAYISLALYLFHRQVYELTSIIINKIGVDLTLLHLYLFMLPLACLTAYLIQKLYDKVINSIFR